MNRECVLMDGVCYARNMKPHLILPCRQCIYHLIITRKEVSIEQQDTVKEQEHICISFGLVVVLLLLLISYL